METVEIISAKKLFFTYYTQLYVIIRKELQKVSSGYLLQAVFYFSHVYYIRKMISSSSI